MLPQQAEEEVKVETVFPIGAKGGDCPGKEFIFLTLKNLRFLKRKYFFPFPKEPPPTPLANNGGGLVVAIPHAHPSPAPSPFPPHCYLPAAAFAGGGGGSVVSVASSSASLSSSPAPRHNNAMAFAGVGGCSPVPVRRQQQHHLQHLQHQAPPQMVNIVPPQAQQVGQKNQKTWSLPNGDTSGGGGTRNNSFFCGMLGKRLSAGESSDQ